MLLETFKNFSDFELLDTGNGFRLERWGEAVLARPDPQIIWPRSIPDDEWAKTWAIFKSGSGDDKGRWEIGRQLPDKWVVQYPSPLPNPPHQGEGNIKVKFLLKLSPFKHTGLFAEQAAQWEWMMEKLKFKNQNAKLKILNLFAYTGGATMVLAKAGCFVTHADASKPSLAWAKENHKLNNLPADAVRWILDDAVKFVQREIKRGAKYDGIIMDPPAFGHSPSGKMWKFNQDLPGLLEDCVKLLSESAKFLIINGYATNSSALSLNNLLEGAMKNRGGKIEFGELCLKQNSGRIISTGIFARWNSSP